LTLTTSRTSIAWKANPRQRVPGRDVPKADAMLAAAATAIGDGAVAGVVVEADAARVAAVADITAAAVGAEDGRHR